MNWNRAKRTAASAAVIYVLFTLGCELDAPPSIYNDTFKGNPPPAITSIDPATGSISGVTQLRIVGTNFSPVDSLNHVFIDTVEAVIDSASSTEIYVNAPKGVVGVNMKVKVTVDGAFKFAEYYYTIEPVAREYGMFNDVDNVISITVDRNENLYAQLTVDGSNVKILKFDAGGNKTVYAKGPFNVPKISQMRMGPDGYLYCQRSASNQLYRVRPGGFDSTELFVTLPITRGSFLDFDSLGNAYIGGRTNVSIAVLLANSQTMRTVGNFSSYEIRGIRVFQGYVYLLAIVTGKKGVFRAKITSSDGNLGAVDTVCNLSLVPGFGTKELMGFDIAANGDVLVGGDHSDPIYRIRNGAATPLYSGLLSRPASDIVWGTGKYIYVNRNANVSSVSLDGVVKRVMKVITDTNGAPNFGK